MSTGDVLDVAMAADDTTFGATRCPGGAARRRAPQVSCPPFSQAAGRFAGEPPGDYSVTLPLEFPGSMVDDDLDASPSA